jgi:pimeloyl-ACP methyl ester carboxylesterase
VLALAHAFDDAVLARGPGVSLTQHGLALSIAVVATVVAVVKFESMRPGLRALTAFTFGVLASVNGGRHAHHVLHEGTTANDVTGVLALVAGVALVGLAAWIPFRHRQPSSVKRWVVRIAVVPVGLLAMIFFYLPVGYGIVDIHSLKKPVGSPPSADYEQVGLTTSDGLKLQAWYRPSRNGAAVLMLSGGGGDIRGTIRHAQMLARHGYGVLLFGGRGTGHSDGLVNSYGWGREKDAAAALDYLATRADVQRIGALGLSTGADMAIDIAARRSEVKAVVADGTAAIGFEDVKEFTGNPMTRLNGWVMFKTIEVIQGQTGPDASLAEMIASSRAPHLLIAAGAVEKTWGEMYDRVGGDRVDLWYLPKATHTAALRQYPREYEQRVVAFFDAHL